MSAVVPVAEIVRNGFVEGHHYGSVVALDPDGAVAWSVGDVESTILPRSCNKPVQALGMVRVGLDLPSDLLALACASHSGEPFHIEGVRRILTSVGLTEADLQTPPDYPLDDAAREQVIRAGGARAPVLMNCSGKHAAMLATCRLNGWDLTTYRDPDHPLQRLMADTLAELAGEPVAATAVDGCGAPVMAISLAGLARAFGRIASAAPGTPEHDVTTAMRAFPEYVGGTRRDVTALIRGTEGLIGKDGAESVHAVGLADGRGVALKIADGGQRARPVVLAAVLRRLGVESSAYARLEDAPILGHGQQVGAVVAVGIAE
jgi:L-asparaginase II